MAQPTLGSRELLIHTGQDPALITGLAARLGANRKLVRRQGISLEPPEALLPAILRNEWKPWLRQQLWRRCTPWRQKADLLMASQSMLLPLLQERKLLRVRQQLETLDLRLVIVIHLLDGMEQLARDYVNKVLALRWCGSFSEFVPNRLKRDPLRYHVDQLFAPMLECCGARGIRFVLHSSQPHLTLPPSADTLLDLCRGGRPGEPGGWSAAEHSISLPSLRRLQLSQMVLGELGQVPKGTQRKRLLTLIQTAIGSHQGSHQPLQHLWAPLLGVPALPRSLEQAQLRLALKAWGKEWPRFNEKSTPITPDTVTHELYSAVMEGATDLDCRRNLGG